VTRAILVAAVALAGAIAGCGSEPTGAPDPEAPASTAKVERGPLADRVSRPGVLTFRARPDGAPSVAINQASGVYTRLPEPGDRVACGDVLYRVDDRPVLLLCGRVPTYRDLAAGDRGPDVRSLNRTLRRLGLGAPRGGEFTSATARALTALQRDRGMAETGTLALGDAVVLPEAARVAKVSAALGAPARPGTTVLSATSARLQVRADLDPTQRDAVRRGDRARVVLPDHTTLSGRVTRIGPAGSPRDAGAAVTIPVAIRLDRPRRARGMEGAPVDVEIATAGVRDALSVPVTALVGTPGGGYAVEVVRPGGRREQVPVTLGLVDTVAGRVQVDGDLRAGDDVAVPGP